MYYGLLDTHLSRPCRVNVRRQASIQRLLQLSSQCSIRPVKYAAEFTLLAHCMQSVSFSVSEKIAEKCCTVQCRKRSSID